MSLTSCQTGPFGAARETTRIREEEHVNCARIACAGSTWPAGAGAVLALALAAVLTAAPAHAREIHANRADTPPVIDGALDDPCWSAATPSGDFHLRYGDGDFPTQPTFVRVCFDDEHLYVAFECHEDDMENLSAAIAHRDADEMGDDDMAVISLDTYHDERSSYVLACTPLGTKKDFHTSECGRSHDIGWDAVWTVATAREADRWTAEFVIPFSELRYRAADEMVWGVDFRRSERPHREFSSWSNADGPTLDPSYYGDLVGLSGIKASRGIRLMPFVMGKYDVSNLYDYPLEPEDSDWDAHPDAGLDLEYDPFDNTTINLTLNPDFAQIEADPNQINLTGSELFLEERRPFFSENADIFRMPLPLLYTRCMEDIVYGGKATGKAGGARFAALYVRSEDLPRDENGNVLTDSFDAPLPPGTNDYVAGIYRQDLGGNATLGAFAATRQGEDDHGNVAALTGGVGLFENLRLTGLAALTERSGEGGDGESYAINWSYEKPGWNSHGELEWLGEDFDPETGFFLPKWQNRLGFNTFMSRGIELSDSWLDHLDVNAWGGRYDYLEGGLQEYWAGGELGFLLTSGDLVGLEFNRAHDRYYYEDDPDRSEFTIYAVTGATVWEGHIFALVLGDYHGSSIVRTRVGSRLQLIEPLTAEFNVRSAHLRDGDDVDWAVGDLKTNYRISSTMFIRNIVRGIHYADNNSDSGSEQRYDLDLLYGWEFSPGSMLYVAYTQPFERAAGDTEVLDPVATIKLSYLMNL
jgi:hypothetical protein